LQHRNKNIHNYQILNYIIINSPEKELPVYSINKLKRKTKEGLFNRDNQSQVELSHINNNIFQEVRNQAIKFEEKLKRKENNKE
jgi:hypothetical protein